MAFNSVCTYVCVCVCKYPHMASVSQSRCYATFHHITAGTHTHTHTHTHRYTH